MLLSRSGRFDEVGAIGLNPPDAEPDNASRRGGSVNRPYLRGELRTQLGAIDLHRPHRENGSDQ